MTGKRGEAHYLTRPTSCFDASDSIVRVKRITKGSRWHIFGFGIVLFLFNVVGIITVIGWLITFPVSTLASASVYRSLAGPSPASA